MIISSQKYLNDEIVAEKKAALIESGVTSVCIPCHTVGEIEGIEYIAICDGHHTRAAAIELGLSIEYSVSADSEGLTGDAYLSARWNDSAWYDMETGSEIW